MLSKKRISTPCNYNAVVVFEMLQPLQSVALFYFEKKLPEVLVRWRYLNASLSLFAYINTDCLSTCRLSVARPASWEHPRAREVSEDIWKRTGRRDISFTARQTCTHSGSHFCCFGLSGATPARSVEKVRTKRKKKIRKREKKNLVSKIFALFFAFELHKFAMRATAVRRRTSQSG